MSAATALVLTAIWLYLIGLRGFKRMKQGERFKEKLLIAPFAGIVAVIVRRDAVQLQMNDYHMKLFVLNGGSWSIEQTKRAAVFSFGSAYCALTCCAWLGWIGGEELLLFVGALLAIVLLLYGFVDAGRKLERRRGQIVTALPDMMSKLMLLVGAGETVQNAFVRCLEGRDEPNHPLYKEWRIAAASIRNGQSFSDAMERLGRSCAVQEAAVFTTVMLLNYRRGGDHFILAVRQLSFSLWEKRKAIARASGEEASAKLVFPLVGILLIMMVLVAAPAVMLMG